MNREETPELSKVEATRPDQKASQESPPAPAEVSASLRSEAPH